MGDPLRLLVAGVSWPMETFLLRLVRGLLEKGMKITLASPENPGPELAKHPGLDWLPTPSWDVPLPRRGVNWAALAARGVVRGRRDLHTFGKSSQRPASWRERLAFTYRLLPFAGRRWDVIYFPWNSAAITYLPLFDLGIPVVISCRGSQVNIAPHNPHRADIRAGLQATFQRAAKVHCVSEVICQEAQLYGLTSEQAVVIHPAVDPEFFRPGERVSSPTFHIVTVGNLNWVKGFEYALQAISLLKDANIPVIFEIIGTGSDYQRILYTIHDLDLAEEVRLLGNLTPYEVREHLQEADVFLLSSLSEGISNAVLEAMACGLPVVTTDAGGMREAVTDGVEGFVVPVRDVHAIADALVILYQQPDLRTQMGDAGRCRVCKEFTLDMQVERFVQLFAAVWKG